MFAPLGTVCVTSGTFSVNRAKCCPLTGRDVTLRLLSRMVSVEQEPRREIFMNFQADKSQ